MGQNLGQKPGTKTWEKNSGLEKTGNYLKFSLRAETRDKNLGQKSGTKTCDKNSGQKPWTKPGTKSETKTWDKNSGLEKP